MNRRNLLLYGTDELPTPLRRFDCGPLGFMVDGSSIRYVTWRGSEVLRAISFIVRDARWGTYAPAIRDLRTNEAFGSLKIAYRASIDGTEGDFGYDAQIVCSSDGTLTFDCSGASRSGLRTNRTGFVVLHAIEGVAGGRVVVEHASGGHDQTRFPELVSPSQPIFDIRSLTHSSAPGVTVTVTMEGEAYEMEDQRNWTDASFKTYVRPLAKGFPYTIRSGEPVEQRVTVRVVETTRALGTQAERRTTVTIGGQAGTMPEVGLALASWSDLPVIESIYLVGRIDLTTGLSELPTAPDGAVVDLDVVIPGHDPDAELRRLAGLSFTPRRILVVPRRDRQSRPANETPAGDASYAEIVAAARRSFPRSEIGGGTLMNFTEFNRNRPPPGIDFISHSTSAIVHAADDHSVMETHEALASVIATARSIAPGATYRLGPATIGAPRDFYPAPPAANPDNVRKPTAEADPRQRGLFGAAFAIGYAAAAARAGVDALTLGCTSGPAGIADAGRPYPVATAIAWLAELAGRPRLEARAPEGLAVIAGDSVLGPILLLANVTAEPRTFSINASIEHASVLDVRALEQSHRPRDIACDGAVTLDAYAILRATIL